MTDRQLHDEVLQELEFEPEVNAARIGVAVEHSVVTLTGYVETYGQKLAAERAARRVYSAKAVVDDLEVKLPARDEVPDPELARNAVQALERLVTIPPDTIRITVRQGHVILEGKVPWYFQRAAAEHAIHHLRGVKSVVNHIAVRSPATSGDVQEQIQRALTRHALLNGHGIRVLMEEGVVVLEGSVSSWQERDAAVQTAWKAPGVTSVDDRLAVVP